MKSEVFQRQNITVNKDDVSKIKSNIKDKGLFIKNDDVYNFLANT